MKNQQFEQIVRNLERLILDSSDEDMLEDLKTAKDSQVDSTVATIRPSTEELELIEFEQLEAKIAKDVENMQKGK